MVPLSSLRLRRRINVIRAVHPLSQRKSVSLKFLGVVLFAGHLLLACAHTGAEGLKSENENDRARAVRTLDDQKTLLEIALRDTSSNVRDEAVERLTSGEALATVGRVEKDWTVVRSILHLLNKKDIRLPHAVVFDLARNAANREVREYAVSKLSDDAELKAVFGGDTDATVRREAVARISDEAFVANAAVSDHDPMIRRALIARRNLPQKLLFSIASTDSENEVRLEAVEKLSDETLIRALLDDGHVSTALKAAAVAKVRDSQYLKQLALDEKQPVEVRKEAIRVLKDPEVAIQLAKTAGPRELRAWALRMMPDKAHADRDLRRIVANAKEDPEVRFLALNLMREDKAYFESFLDDPVLRTRVTAWIEDTEPLVRRAMNADDSEFLSALIARLAALEAADSLEQLVRNAKSPTARLWALNRFEEHLKDGNIIGEILKKEQDPRVREEALSILAKHLKDGNIIAEILKKEQDPRVREKALSILAKPVVVEGRLTGKGAAGVMISAAPLTVNDQGKEVMILTYEEGKVVGLQTTTTSDDGRFSLEISRDTKFPVALLLQSDHAEGMLETAGGDLVRLTFGKLTLKANLGDIPIKLRR
jgi:hypothetical protein